MISIDIIRSVKYIMRKFVKYGLFKLTHVISVILPSVPTIP